MYKLNVVNELTGKESNYSPPNKVERDRILDKMIGREHWGKNQRVISEESISEELRSRIISTEVISQVGTPVIPEVLDEEGNVVAPRIEASIDYQPERTEHTVKADYVITEVDLSQDKAYRNKQKIEARKKEYKSIEEVMHIILDYGMDSQEFIDLQAERAAIKSKYPKEV